MSDSPVFDSRMPDPPTPEAIRHMLESQVAPGVRRLINLIVQEAQAHNLEIYLVGGFVRDLILKRPSLDLDFTIVGDGHTATAPIVVKALSDRYGGESTIHQAFLTATWTPPESMRAELNLPTIDGEPLTVDLVTARRETYAYPGALPTVEPGTLTDDLFRRDFTINAMAIKLPEYEWVDQHGGFDDLSDGILRVLHDRSFEDDPTRITRLIRFVNRFKFEIPDDTFDQLEPLPASIKTVSGDRWRNELTRIFGELTYWNDLWSIQGFGLLGRIAPGIKIIANDRLHRSLAALHHSLPELQKMGFGKLTLDNLAWILILWSADNPADLVSRLRLPPDAINAVKGVEHGFIALHKSSGILPSKFVRFIEPIDLPTCAVLWAVVPDSQRPMVERYVQQWRTMQPITTGDDLKARGLSPGPVFGTLLKQLRDAWLDGEVTSTESEQTLLDRLIAALPDKSTPSR